MKSQFRWALGPALGALVVCLLMVPASAAPVQGKLGFGGPGVLTFSEGGGASGTNFIDWCPVNVAPEPEGSVGCGILNNGTGSLTVDSVSQEFVDAGNAPGTAGTILDITDANPAPANYTFIPLGGGVPIVGFLDFADPWTYTLDAITPQTCAPTATTSCTGYFILLQTSPTTVAVNMAGVGRIENSAGEISNFDLVITGQFTNSTIASVIAAAITEEGAFTNAWSGQLSAVAAPIPEPGTTAMLMLGLAGLGLGAVRPRRKA